MARTASVPARMSFEDCAARAAQSERRIKRAMRADAKKASRSYQGPYAGSRMSRLEFDWIASCIAADEEVKRDAYRLRSRARELARNNRLAKQYLRLVQLNVIGADGIKYQAQVRDNSGALNKRINDKLEAGWEDWSRAVTLDGKHSRIQLERQLAGVSRVDGEVLVRMWRGTEYNAYGLALEPIDADQLDHEMNRPRGTRSPEIRMGIEVDDLSRPLAYHVWNGALSYARDRSRVRIPAEQMIHVFDPDRVNQSRGVTDFHSVMLPMHFLEEYAQAELVASRIGAAKPIIWQRREGMAIGTLDPNNPNRTDDKPQPECIEPGIAGFAPDGYEPARISLDHPSTAFEAFMRECKREIAAGLGVGYAALSGDLSDTSFSSSRSGTELERDNWRGKQTWWMEEFEVPIHREWVMQSVLVGAATNGAQGLVLDSRDPRRFMAAKFMPRGWQYVNPQQGANAAAVALQHGLTSRTRLAAEAGDSVEDIFDELEAERLMAEARGITISDAEAARVGQDAQAAAEMDAVKADAAKKSHANGHANGTNRIREALEAAR